MKLASAMELRNGNRREVEINGRGYEIRKLGPAELAALGGGFDLSGLLEVAERAKADPGKLDPEILANMTAFLAKVLSRGVSSMRILVEDPGRRLQDDEILLQDFPEEDKMPLMNAIMDSSGWSVAEAEKVRPS